MTAILGNQVEGGFATTGEAGTYVKAGKFRLLGVMAPQRLKSFPDVPTFKERGIDLELGTWRALAAPKGTPPSVIAKMKNEVQRVTQEKNRSEEHTSELQSLMRISYAVFCLKKKTPHTIALLHDDNN